MKTAVVILNWNGKGFLEKFLPGLLMSVEGLDAKVIIADNASSDGSAEMLAESFPTVRTIRLDRNYGFTGGYNRAFAQINAEYFVLINSDIEVPADWLSPLVEWMDKHRYCGVCAPKLHSYERKDMFEYAGAAGGYIDRFGYPFCRGRVMKHVEKDYGQYDSPASVFWASGACMMIRAELYRRLGGLDERFFAHMEEIDLCWRVQLNGYNVMTVPYSTVYHVGGGTLPNDSPFKLFLNFRNNLLMLSNNLAFTYAIGYMQNLSGNGSRKHRQDEEKAAEYGIRRAGKTILGRMILDGCSAAVYLLTFRLKCFKAVLKAHKDYRKLRKSPDRDQIVRFLEDGGNQAVIRGLYPHCIVLQAALRRRHASGMTHEFKDF